MRVEEFLEASASRLPFKDAIVCGERRTCYQEMDQLANRLAHSLSAAGIQRGERVVVYMDNSTEAVAAIFATLKIGGVFVVVNPTTKADKLEYILANCRATGVITDEPRVKIVSSCRSALRDLKAVWAVADSLPPDVIDLKNVLRDSAGSERLPIAGIDIDLAALIYTSGSTGRPKGVMLTHLNIVSAAASITTYLENVADDVILSVLPLSFDYGLYQVLMAFKVGATIILERSFTYPHAVLERVVRDKVTGFPIVPTISAILMQLDLKKYAFPHLRYITNTAAALPVQHISYLHETLPHVRIYSMYGLTECKRVTYLPPEQLDIRPGSVGRGMPNEEVYLVDDGGTRLPNGSTGELVVRGSNVMKGYWELPEETDRKLKPGPYPWEKVLYTGDLFRTDSEGYLFFLSRKDDIIKTKGEKVSPKEVEDVLYGIPQVAEAAVIGVPDPVSGQAIKAFLTLRNGASLTEGQVLRHCAQHLEDFMVPKCVEFRATLPTTSTGKVSKLQLASEALGAS